MARRSVLTPGASGAAHAASRRASTWRQQTPSSRRRCRRSAAGARRDAHDRARETTSPAQTTAASETMRGSRRAQLDAATSARPRRHPRRPARGSRHPAHARSIEHGGPSSSSVASRIRRIHQHQPGGSANVAPVAQARPARARSRPARNRDYDSCRASRRVRSRARRMVPPVVFGRMITAPLSEVARASRTCFFAVAVDLPPLDDATSVWQQSQMVSSTSISGAGADADQRRPAESLNLPRRTPTSAGPGRSAVGQRKDGDDVLSPAVLVRRRGSRWHRRRSSGHTNANSRTFPALALGNARQGAAGACTTEGPPSSRQSAPLRLCVPPVPRLQGDLHQPQRSVVEVSKKRWRSARQAQDDGVPGGSSRALCRKSRVAILRRRRRGIHAMPRASRRTQPQITRR
jgi:hypothetical protein